MGTPYLGEMRIISWNYAPKGWAFCNGQTLAIQQNQALFSLLGTTYGGNGVQTFQLPNLQGRVPMHFGNGFVQGQVGGEVSHTLTTQEIPTHVHTLLGTNTASTTNTPAGNMALAVTANTYTGATNLTALAPNELGGGGASQPHENEQPYTVLNVCIALQGIFPSRN